MAYRQLQDWSKTRETEQKIQDVYFTGRLRKRVRNIVLFLVLAVSAIILFSNLAASQKKKNNTELQSAIERLTNRNSLGPDEPVPSADFSDYDPDPNAPHSFIYTDQTIHLGIPENKNAGQDQ